MRPFWPLLSIRAAVLTLSPNNWKRAADNRKTTTIIKTWMWVGVQWQDCYYIWLGGRAVHYSQSAENEWGPIRSLIIESLTLFSSQYSSCHWSTVRLIMKTKIYGRDTVSQKYYESIRLNCIAPKEEETCASGSGATTATLLFTYPYAFSARLHHCLVTTEYRIGWWSIHHHKATISYASKQDDDERQKRQNGVSMEAVTAQRIIAHNKHCTALHCAVQRLKQFENVGRSPDRRPFREPFLQNSTKKKSQGDGYCMVHRDNWHLQGRRAATIIATEMERRTIRTQTYLQDRQSTLIKSAMWYVKLKVWEMWQCYCNHHRMSYRTCAMKVLTGDGLALTGTQALVCKTRRSVSAASCELAQHELIISSCCKLTSFRFALALLFVSGQLFLVKSFANILREQLAHYGAALRCCFRHQLLSELYEPVSKQPHCYVC